MSKSLASSFSPHLMDPATSAYYAALYSQQMYGLSPYAGMGGGMRPGGMSVPSSSSGSSQAAATAMAAAAAAGLDPLQASALQVIFNSNSLCFFLIIVISSIPLFLNCASEEPPISSPIFPPAYPLLYIERGKTISMSQ